MLRIVQLLPLTRDQAQVLERDAMDARVGRHFPHALEQGDGQIELATARDDGDDRTTDDPATASPLPCPTTDTFTATKTIGLWGGTVSAGGSSITLPFGAVLSPTTITLTVPASEYMEVDIQANGQEHYTFLLPVTIVMGYQQCTDPAFDEGPLVAWYWDSLLEILLQPFPSVDDKTARTVTFESNHLSVFVIAN